MSSSCVSGRHLAKLSDQLRAAGGLEASHFTPRGKLVFEMYLKVSGAGVMLQLTEMPEFDRVAFPLVTCQRKKISRNKFIYIAKNTPTYFYIL